MPPLLRRRLECFYCGRRSAQKYTDGLSQFECANCDAVNHLDENGEITDPPAYDDSSSNKRYAQQIHRPISPVFTASSSEETLFCQTCLRNQHLLAQNLADYLPPVSDPRYDEYERNYPKYRKGLEERYPQVCEKCEPKVRERLKITGYAAKTDHLRRMMERTKNTRLAPRMKIGWVWTDLFTYGGAVGWVIALVGQIYWNVMGLLALPEDGLRDNQANLTIPQCLVQAFNAHKVEPICLQTAHTLASFTLVVAFLSLWWNPAMLSGPMRRAGGLGEYYKLQFIINGLRLLVWYVLGRQTELGLEDRIVKAVHATMLIFNLLVSVTSYRTAYIDRTPIVSFHDVEEPLLTPKSGHLSGEPSHTHRSPPSSRPLGSKTPQSLARSFQIGNLSTPTRRPENANYQSPAPPPDDQYEFDAMDIDTPQKSFHPAPSIHLHQPTPKRPEQPSPFYGRLPPAPRSMEHKLRNPPTHQIQIPSSQENFFGASRDSVSPVSTKAGDPLDSPVSPRQFDMAAPRFFAPSKNDEVTGLESLFAGIFSLKDEPAELRAAQAKQDEEKHSGGRVSRPWKQLSNIALLAGSGLSWLYATKYPQYTTTLYFASLSASCLVSGRHLVSSLSLNLPFWTLSDILLYTIEAVIATGLAYEVHKTRLNERTVIDSLRWIPQFYFICMLVQELLLIGKAIRSKPRNSTPHLHSKSTTTSPRNPSSLPVEQNPSFKPRPSAPSIEKNFKTPTKATTSQMQLHERQTPRTSRTKEKPARQSSGMSGLGLGNSPDRGGTNTRTEVWNGNQNSRVLRRQVPPWERGSM